MLRVCVCGGGDLCCELCALRRGVWGGVFGGEVSWMGIRLILPDVDAVL